MDLRAQFPVLEHMAYLKRRDRRPDPGRGRCTPRARSWRPSSPRAACGRTSSAASSSTTELRAGYARVLGCAADDLAITTSTSDGIGRVLAGLDLGPDDEILTSDQEHPGLIGPLIAARRRGATVRALPMRELADAVGPKTTLVACSHVNWITGETAPAALADVGVPVVLDGAQGAGAGADRPRRARLRRLRRLGPEVDVRRRRHRHALTWPPSSARACA
jgi:L-cysteine/cystine lyase